MMQPAETLRHDTFIMISASLGQGPGLPRKD